MEVDGGGETQMEVEGDSGVRMEMSTDGGALSPSDNQTGSFSPGQRPSYVNFRSTSGLYPSVQPFDERVIKRLELESLNETTNTDVSGLDVSADDEKLKTFLRIRPIAAHIHQANQVSSVLISTFPVVMRIMHQVGYTITGI